MGAKPWQYVGPYDRDPAVALQLAQHDFLQANYDLPVFIADALRNAEECVAAVQVDDEFGLLETYTATLEAVRNVAAGPVPSDQNGQIRRFAKWRTRAARHWTTSSTTGAYTSQFWSFTSLR